MTVAPHALTADELLWWPDDSYRYALVRGELIRMPPAGFDHSVIEMRLAAALTNHVTAHPPGLVCGAKTGFVLVRNPDTLLAPDVAFVRRERIPATSRPRTSATGHWASPRRWSPPATRATPSRPWWRRGYSVTASGSGFRP